MAQVQFPSSPSDGDVYTVNNVSYTWNNTSGLWEANNATALADTFVAVSGDTMTGNLTLPGGGGDTQAVQRQEIDSSFVRGVALASTAIELELPGDTKWGIQIAGFSGGSGADVTINFAATFATTPSVTATMTAQPATAAEGWTCSIYNITTSSAVVAPRYFTSGAVMGATQGFQLIAIGLM